ncbi:hypothetical protein [Actinophytocola sp.]|uniref:hypothetical protein n=1 Tax=Actinophytocola sp. TaxID=1872138 RepID=UPI002ED2DE69
MPHNTERPAIMLGLLMLFGLTILTVAVAVPEFGYGLLGLVVTLVVGLVVGFVVAWRRTRFQPRDDQHRPARQSTPVARSDVREVA